MIRIITERRLKRLLQASFKLGYTCGRDGIPFEASVSLIKEIAKLNPNGEKQKGEGSEK